MTNPPFPYLDENDYFEFPPVENSSPEGIVATGGNLSPGMLISAYEQGIFPWYSPFEPILWWSPDPRFILFFEDLHISKSMKKVFRKDKFEVTFDTAFEQIIYGCRDARRPGQEGTWITGEMIEGYCKLHEIGYAHSVEVWQGEILAGGLYGVSFGRCFFGESMFSKMSDSSKTAFIYLAKTMEEAGFHFIDSQVYTPHVATLGAVEISRSEYLKLLEKGLRCPSLKGKWTDCFPRRQTSEILKYQGRDNMGRGYNSILK